MELSELTTGIWTSTLTALIQTRVVRNVECPFPAAPKILRYVATKTHYTSVFLIHSQIIPIYCITQHAYGCNLVFLCGVQIEQVTFWTCWILKIEGQFWGSSLYLIALLSASSRRQAGAVNYHGCRPTGRRGLRVDSSQTLPAQQSRKASGRSCVDQDFFFGREMLELQQCPCFIKTGVLHSNESCTRVCFKCWPKHTLFHKGNLLWEQHTD